VRQRRATRVAGLAIQVKVEVRARGELDWTLGKSAQAELRPLQVGKDADWPPRRTFYPPDRREPRAVVFMCAMAEIEPENVDARLEQRADPVRG